MSVRFQLRAHIKLLAIAQDIDSLMSAQHSRLTATNYNAQHAKALWWCYELEARRLTRLMEWYGEVHSILMNAAHNMGQPNSHHLLIQELRDVHKESRAWFGLGSVSLPRGLRRQLWEVIVILEG